jgi:DNA-binding transcriptional MerR regulator
MALSKSAEAFRTISEAAAEIDVPQHVLRHWEDVFGQIRPMRRAGGRRYYRPVDIDILRGVRTLLYNERYSTRGVQKIFRENGVKYVAEVGRMAAAGQPFELRPLLDEEPVDRSTDGHSEASRAIEAEGGAAGGVTPQSLRLKLEAVLVRLERVQDALDEAALALEAIDTDD